MKKISSFLTKARGGFYSGIVFSCAAALALSVFPSSASARGTDTLSNIRAAVASGEITSQQGAIEALRALFEPQNVSKSLRGRPLHRRSDCATMLFRGVLAQLPSMSADEQALARSIIGNRTAPASLATLPNKYYTAHFQIEWGDDYALSDIDGTKPAPDLDGNGDPDVIQRWADYFEYSYSTLGYLGYPVNLTGPKMRVVIANTSFASEYQLSDGYFGVTYQMSDGTIWMIVNSSFAGFVLDNDDPDGSLYGAMKVTAAHEFFHAVQFRMLPEAWDSTFDDWWLEASSVWAEEKVYDDVNDYYSFWHSISDSWIENEERSLPITRPYGTEVYERGLFPLYIDEHAGGPSAVKRLWDLIRGGKRILFTDAAGNATTGSAMETFALEKGMVDETGAADIGKIYTGFVAANAVMDYEEGLNYPQPSLRSVSSIATGGNESIYAPGYLGATFRREAGSDGPMRMFVSGQPANNWGMTGTIKRGSPPYSLSLTSNDTDGSASVQFDALSATDEVFCAPSYLMTGSTSSSYDLRKNYLLSPVKGSVTPALTADDVTTAPVRAGIKLSWAIPSSLEAGGTVILWQKASGGSWKSKTIVAPLNEAVIGGLDHDAEYNIRIWLYDNRGVEGSALNITATSGEEVPPLTSAPKTSAPSSSGGSDVWERLNPGCFIRSLLSFY